MRRDIYLTTFGDWNFYERDFGNGEVLYGYAAKDGSTKTFEYFNDLEHAVVAAIAEKYTGQRGSGGTGVDTAAGWFWAMMRGYRL